MSDIFNIDQSRFSALSSSQCIDLFRNLLWCEARRVGLSPHHIVISTDETIADGGIDARIDGNVTRDSILADGQIFYQLKSGTAFKPWQVSCIKKEVFGKSQRSFTRDALGDAVKFCMDNNGKYVLVTFGHDLTDQQQRAARSHLENFFLDLGYSSPQVVVLGQTQLAGLLAPFPSLSLAVHARSHLLFQMIDSWRGNDDMRPILQIGPTQTAFIAEIRDTLACHHIQHIRIIGEPGTGKSRLVLEAVSAEEISPSVLYVASGDDFQKGALFNELIRADRGYVVTLVIDDCGDRDRASIYRTLKGREGIKLITIDHGPEESTDSSMKVLYCPLLEKERVAQIIGTYIGQLHETSNWAEWCGGSPRVAHAVGENLRKNPHDILKSPATVPIWDRFILGHQDLTEMAAEEHLVVLRHIALFQKFGFDFPVDGEGRFIGNMVQQANPAITWARFQSIVQHHRKRRILQGQTTLFIVPKALHVYLWLGFWEEYGRGFDFGSFINGLPDSLKKWFMALFIYAHGSKVAGEMVKKVLSLEQGPFVCSDFVRSETGATFLSVLAEANPHATLSVLSTTIDRMSEEELLHWESGWQQIVWTLEKIAVWEDCFTEAARLLSLMAPADHTSFCNNSRGTFLGFFMAGARGWAPTQAPPEVRFLTMIGLMRSPQYGMKRLGLEACKVWLSTHGGSRIVGVEYQGLRPTIKFWQPKTWGEIFEWYLKVWDFLWEESQTWSDSEKQKAYEVLLESASGLVQISAVADRIVDTIFLMAADRSSDKKRIVHVIIHLLKFRDKHLQPKIITRLLNLDNFITGDTFQGRFNRWVLWTDWDEDHDFVDGKVKDNPIPSLAVQGLVEEVYLKPELLDEHVDTFVASEGHRLYEFGSRIGKMLGYQVFERIFKAQQDALPLKNTQFLGGYLSAVKEQDCRLWEDLILSMMGSEPVRAIGMDLIFRTGGSEKIAHDLVRMYREKMVASSVFSRFGVFRGEDDLSFRTVNIILETLLEDPDDQALSQCIHLASDYFSRQNGGSDIPEDLAFRLLTRPYFFERTAQHDVGYYWHKVAKIFRQHYSHRDIEFLGCLLSNLQLSLRSDHPCMIADEIAGQRPYEAWKVVTGHLAVDGPSQWYICSWLGDEIDFGEEGSPGAIRFFDPGMIMEWLREDPNSRVPVIARCLPKTLDADRGGELTRLFIDEYGDDDDTAGDLISHFWSGGWSGPESILRSQQRETARQWLSQATSPKVRHWLLKYINDLSTSIDTLQIYEERR